MLSIKEIKILNFALFITVFLNSVDLISTWIGLKYDLIEEVNPLMKYLFDKNLAAVILFKLSVAMLLLFIIKITFIQRKTISRWILFPFIAYLFIGMMHISWITAVFTRIDLINIIQMELTSILMLLFSTILLMVSISTLATRFELSLTLKRYRQKEYTLQKSESLAQKTNLLTEKDTNQSVG